MVLAPGELAILGHKYNSNTRICKNLVFLTTFCLFQMYANSYHSTRFDTRLSPSHRRYCLASRSYHLIVFDSNTNGTTRFTLRSDQSSCVDTANPMEDDFDLVQYFPSWNRSARLYLPRYCYNAPCEHALITERYPFKVNSLPEAFLMLVIYLGCGCGLAVSSSLWAVRDRNTCGFLFTQFRQQYRSIKL